MAWTMKEEPNGDAQPPDRPALVVAALCQALCPVFPQGFLRILFRPETHCVLVLRTHPVGSVVSNVKRRFVHLPVFVLAPLHEAVDDDAQAPISHGYRCQGPTCFSSHFQRQSKGSYSDRKRTAC